jgi:hypothetical protein
LETACPQAVSINNKRRRSAGRFNNRLCISHEVLLESDAFRIAFIHDNPQLDTPP